jgi:hypothetical protein
MLAHHKSILGQRFFGGEEERPRPVKHNIKEAVFGVLGIGALVYGLIYGSILFKGHFFGGGAK